MDDREQGVENLANVRAGPRGGRGSPAWLWATALFPLVASSLAILAHTAYHLGEIRRALCVVQVEPALKGDRDV